MDVIVPYGINYKKCTKKSYSGYKRLQIFPYLEQNLLQKNKELSMALIAELHCSCYFKDIDDFIICFFSNYYILSGMTYSYFIERYFQKIINMKKVIPKSQQNIALINSTELRNMYCSIFTFFLENPIVKFNTKISNKCYRDEYYLPYCNLQEITIVYDNNNNALSNKLSKGIRELLFWLSIKIDPMSVTLKKFINPENLEKILFWIHWCTKIESIERKINKNNLPQYCFLSKFSSLQNKQNDCWEFFVWDKIWQECQKNKFVNKNLLKSISNLFYHNYRRNLLKDRAGLIAIGILIAKSHLKIEIERKITKMEIFTNLNANNFYKNIHIDEDNDEKYIELYNSYHNIKPKEKLEHKKMYKLNKIEQKMDFLTGYLPKVGEKNDESEDKKTKKISDYFSSNN